MFLFYQMRSIDSMQFNITITLIYLSNLITYIIYIYKQMILSIWIIQGIRFLIALFRPAINISETYNYNFPVLYNVIHIWTQTTYICSAHAINEHFIMKKSSYLLKTKALFSTYRVLKVWTCFFVRFIFPHDLIINEIALGRH